MMNWGIDKTILAGLIIEEVDLEKLRSSITNESKSIIDIVQDLRFMTCKMAGSDESIAIRKLRIVDEVLFNSFTIDFKKSKQQIIPYTILDVSIDSKEKVGNLKPMNYQEYILKLENIKNYLASRYGIYVSFEEARFKSIELNETSVMDYQFYDYEFIFKAVVNNRNHNKYSKFSKMGDGYYDEHSTIYVSSKYQELKIYDKTKQMKAVYKMDIEPNTMRIEYTLEGKAVANYLGSNKIKDLSDDTIKKFLNDSIKADIFNAMDKELKTTNKELTKLYQEVKSSMKRGYLREFFHRASHIALDQAQVEAIALQDMKKSGHYKKNKALLESIIPNQHNMDKIEEFKSKFIIV